MENYAWVARLVLSCCLLTTGISIAWAQEEDDEASENSSLMEEVTVTARKREESLMEIPVSVSAITSEMIAEANIVDINDIAAKTPGLKFNSAFGRQGDRPVIRGISSIFTTEELVGYFIDGVYMAGSIQSFDLSSVERVEVIKGPQSAVFGRRTFAGAINYVTAHPQDEWDFDAKATLGSNGLVDLSGVIGGRPSESFGWRLAVRGYEYDGDFENTLEGGPPVGGQSSRSANLGLFFYPSDATTIRLNLNYSKDEDDHFVLAMFRRADLDVCRTDVTRPYHCGEVPGDLPVSLGGFMPDSQYGVDRTRNRMFFKLDHEFSWASFSWTSAYNKENSWNGADQTYLGLRTNFSFATFGQVPATGWHTRFWTDRSDYSHEAWFRGDALDGNLTWGVGAYYYNEDGDSLGLNADNTAYQDKTFEITNTALMASVDYQIGDSFKLGGEIRQANDDIRDDLFENDWDSTTYRVTGSWFYNDDGMAYIGYSTGVLPGGFNTDPRLPAQLQFIDEQTMSNFEIGWKATLSDTFSITAALFMMEWKDQVRSEFFIDPSLDVSIGYKSNQGSSDINGLELYAHWYPTERIHLEAGGTFTDTEIKDFISPDPTDIQWSANGDGDVSGNQIPLSPETDIYLAGSYTHPLSGGMELVARMDYAYQSKRYVRTINYAHTGDETLLGAQLTLDAENWSVMLWGKNLTDEDSAVSTLRYFEANSFFFGGRSFAVTPRPGREFGVTFRYRY